MAARERAPAPHGRRVVQVGRDLRKRDIVAEIAQVARLFHHPTRVGILAILLNGETTTSDLAARLGLEPARISSHLRILLAKKLVAVRVAGRQHRYAVSAVRIAPAFAVLSSLGPHRWWRRHDGPPRLTPRARTPDLRRARTCYDHLAGMTGVRLLDAFLRRGWVKPIPGQERPLYRLTMKGARALVRRGVNVIRAHPLRRRFACACPDWIGGRPHLGGSLGAVLLEALLRAAVVHRDGRTRRITLVRPVESWLAGRAGWTQ